MSRSGLSCSALVLAVLVAPAAHASSGAYAAASAGAHAHASPGVTYDMPHVGALPSQQCYHYGEPVPCESGVITGGYAEPEFAPVDECHDLDPCAEVVDVHPAPVVHVDPAPHPVSHGWSPKVFIGVRAGASLLNGLEFDATPRGAGGGKGSYPGYIYGYAPKGSVGSTTVDLDVEAGYAAGAEIGVETAYGWRAKVEYLHLSNDIDPVKGLNDGATVTASGGFVTVEKAFGGHYKLRPYLGVGAGLVDIDLGDLDAETEVAGAVKLSAGLGLQLHKNIEGFAEYAYVYAPGVEASDKSFDYEFDYGAHVVGAGVRLSFH